MFVGQRLYCSAVQVLLRSCGADACFVGSKLCSECVEHVLLWCSSSLKIGSGQVRAHLTYIYIYNIYIYMYIYADIYTLYIHVVIYVYIATLSMI